MKQMNNTNDIRNMFSVCTSGIEWLSLDRHKVIGVALLGYMIGFNPLPPKVSGSFSQIGQ